MFDGASKASDIGDVPGYIDAQMPTLNWDYTFMFNLNVKVLGAPKSAALCRYSLFRILSIYAIELLYNN